MPLNIELLPQSYAKQVREKGQQYYVDSKGDRFPSVTTILNATKPQADRDALFNWRQRVGTAQANQISGAASRRGTATHQYIQRYLLGEEIPCAEAVQPYWDSLQPVIKDIDHIRLIEGFVCHDALRYGGRVDCVASYQGIPCICDWKTADKPKQSVERLYDGPLQLAAYSGAVNQFYQAYNIQLNHALIVVAIPGSLAQVFWFEPEQMVNYWQQWEARVATYWRQSAIA